jgi:flavin reductase (DIM6/NTAB) family NADH-FMN oxidoreductase RutF
MTPEVLPERTYREVVGRLATGVTVIRWDDGEHTRGMTANAVCSLSLDPTLILICVDKNVTAHGQLARATAPSRVRCVSTRLQ